MYRLIVSIIARYCNTWKNGYQLYANLNHHAISIWVILFELLGLWNLIQIWISRYFWVLCWCWYLSIYKHINLSPADDSLLKLEFQLCNTTTFFSFPNGLPQFEDLIKPMAWWKNFRSLSVPTNLFRNRSRTWIFYDQLASWRNKFL